MKSDSIFYRLFKIFPHAFFELINLPENQAKLYNFASIEVKQTAFRLDGVFIPQQPYYNYRFLLESPMVTRFYLNELNTEEQLPLGVALIKLIVERKQRISQTAQQLIERTRQEIQDSQEQKNVLELIETIILYKLPLISRQELGKMFSTFDVKKTRYYQELKEEAMPLIREEVISEVRQEVISELLPEIQNQQQEFNQQLKQKMLEVALKLLRHRFSSLTPEQETQLQQLSLEQLNELTEAILDFSEISDFITWLNQATS